MTFGVSDRAGHRRGQGSSGAGELPTIQPVSLVCQTGPVTPNGYRASLNKRRTEVAAMFDKVAGRYDLTNNLLSLGLTEQWRKAVLRAIDPRPGVRILDLAAGTGTSTIPLTEAGATAIPVDLSLGMLEVGKQRHPELPFLAGDALSLPFGDEVADVVTISFGLRNVEDTVAALTEFRRVTRPGGKLVVCEFSTPTWEPFRRLYDFYLQTALPLVSRAMSSNPAAYNYLIESIRDWPNQPGLAELMQRAGWHDIAWNNLAGGAVAIHRAIA
ncbi:demethylmenaquinone methyltransferase [Naumannella halotolerans]|uniref:demethylmenaquinone methyltransferase n=1 Tax=Naumannella halotolerans TaxID=993414 RepID=UPI003C7BB567